MADGAQAAHVEVLAAEVRVLMVGSRQVTLSVYGQLDNVPDAYITPMGRVAPKDGHPGWVYIVGRHKETGSLVRSSLPCTGPEIATLVRSRSRLAHWQHKEEDALKRADALDSGADEDELTAEKLVSGGDGSAYITVYDRSMLNVPYCRREAARWREEAEKAAKTCEASTDPLERLGSEADRARFNHEAGKAGQQAQEAEATAEQLRGRAAKRRTVAETWRNSADEFSSEVSSCEEKDSDERGRIALISDEWAELPLIVLAGLR